MKKRSCHTRVAAVTMHYAAMLLVAVLGVLPAAPAVAQSTDDSLRIYAVRVGGRYGVYLGNGLIITAAHVAGPRVRIADLDLPAKIIKSSPFEELDLALLSVDAQNLPVSQRLRRMPLCQRTPVVGAAVIVAIPEGTARSQIMSPKWLPAHMRTKFPTLIRDVATTGDSGIRRIRFREKMLAWHHEPKNYRWFSTAEIGILPNILCQHQQFATLFRPNIAFERTGMSAGGSYPTH